MPSYGRGDRVTFTGEVVAELLGVGGIVLRRRIGSEGHYVYDIQIKTHLPVNIPGLNLSASGVLRNVPGSWFELFR
jgi:hypothetical protein